MLQHWYYPKMSNKVSNASLNFKAKYLVILGYLIVFRYFEISNDVKWSNGR